LLRKDTNRTYDCNVLKHTTFTLVVTSKINAMLSVKSLYKTNRVERE